MRVLVASTIVPNLLGGGRMIVTDLVSHLRRRGHDVEELLLPSSSHPAQLSEQLVAMRLAQVEDVGDRMIAIRAPAHLLRHHNKVLWFIHHQRQAYDLWGTPYQGIPNSSEGRQTRHTIVTADSVAFPEARAIFTNSRTVSNRLHDFNGVRSEVLYPPLGDPTGYQCGAFEGYIVCPSRITWIKRQHLLIESMAHVTTDVRLVLVGAPDGPSDRQLIETALDTFAVRDRVTFPGHWISESDKQRLIANALGCCYIPYDEDSYGYATLESFHSGKPMITCRDSGGTMELVEDGVNGFVVDPTPVALAAAMDLLYKDRELARRLGTAGVDRLHSLNINWDHVVNRLLS